MKKTLITLAILSGLLASSSVFSQTVTSISPFFLSGSNIVQQNTSNKLVANKFQIASSTTAGYVAITDAFGNIHFGSAPATAETDPIWTAASGNYSTTAQANNLYIGMGTTSVNSITTLNNLSILKSQVSDFGTYESPLTFTYPLNRLLNNVSLSDMSTTTATCTGSTSCSPFTVIGNSPITISSSSGSSISQLGQIPDVATSSPMTYGEVLRYNTGNSKWESVATSTLGLPTFDGTNYFTGYNSFINSTTTGTLYAGLVKLPLVTAPSYYPGTLFYESYGNLDSLSFYGSHSGTTLNIGKELWKDVRNCNSGGTILNGTAVYLTGSTIGQIPCVLPANSSTLATSNIVGVVTEDILDNNDGIATTFGIINGLDTSGLSDGASLYLATTTTGSLNNFRNMTTTKPNAPYYNVSVGEVDYSHPTLGKIELRIGFPKDLSDNKDFSVSSPTNGQILMYDSSVPAWKNVATTSLGTITVPYGGTGSTTLTGILKGNGTSPIQTAIPNTDYTPAVITSAFDLINGSSANTAQRFPANNSATLKFLSSAGNGTDPTTMSWQTIPALGSYTYFFTNTVDGSYLDMVNSTSTVTTYSTPYTAVATDTLLQSWVTPTGFPNLTNIPAGIWKFHIDANKTAGTKDIALYAKVYKLSGVTETLLFTTQNSENITSSSSTNYQEMDWDYYDASAVSLLSTDRIIVKIYTSTSGLGTDPSGSIFYLNSTQSRVEFPSSTVSVDNFVPYVGATKNVDLGLFNASSTQSTISDKLWLNTYTGLLKGTSGLIGTATAGVDYESPLTFTYPLIRSTNTISSALATTTSNTWAGTQTFDNASTTLQSIANSLWVGGMATTTGSTGNIDTVGTTTASKGFVVGTTGYGVKFADGTVQTTAASSGGSTAIYGTGEDGALNISSGTTNIDLGGAPFLLKNYSSISITGTGKLTFTNPHANGTQIIFKSQGDVTITSSTVPAIELTGLGANGGVNTPSNTAGSNAQNFITTNVNMGGAVGAQSSNAAGGARTTASTTSLFSFSLQFPQIGAGGGSGSPGNGGATTSAGAGGKGGGSIVIFCGGALNSTSTIYAKGNAGSNGTTDPSGNPGGGGGGGGGGGIFILYKTLTANTGTYTVTGGAAGVGGTQAGSSYAGGGGGGGGGELTAGSNGNPKSADKGGDGGAGGTGKALIAENVYFK